MAESNTLVTGYVYQLRNLIIHERFYIGSTDLPLNKRFNLHLSKSYNENSNDFNTKKAQYIRAVSDRNHIRQYIIIELIEEVIYEDGTSELEEREQYWINSLVPSTNSKRAHRTEEEKTEQLKKYREENVEEIKEQLKKYREENREKIKEQKKKYYSEKKNKINEKIICSCGSVFVRQNKARHLNSAKHIAWDLLRINNDLIKDMEELCRIDNEKN